MKKFVALCFVLLNSSLCLAESPKLYIPETVYDFGSVNEGTEVNHTFEIQNVGNADLRIERVVSGCNCLAHNVTSEAILPDTTSTLDVNFNTRGMRGKVEKKIKIFTNENVYSDAYLTLRGTILPEINVTPAYINLNTVYVGDKNVFEQEVSVSVRSDANLKLGSVKSFSKNIFIKNIQGDERKKTFSISLNKTDLKVGEFRDRVIIEVIGGSRKSINIPIFAFVRNPIYFEPRAVSLGAIERGIIKKEARLKNALGQDFEIEDISSKSSIVDASYKKVSRGEYLVELSINTDRIKRELKSSVLIETNSELQPEVILDVHGYRKGTR